MKSNGVAVYPDSCVDTQLCKQVSNNKSGRIASFRESGGSKRKSGAPDFFRLPCGAKQICVYLRYTFPPLKAALKDYGIPRSIPELDKWYQVISKQIKVYNDRAGYIKKGGCIMAKDENVKTIRFPVKADQKLLAIANKCGLTKLDFFIYMVDYFYKSKKDPRDLNDELLKNAINKKTDNIIAFIRTQEQELLIPMKKDGERMIASQLKIVDSFNLQIIKHNNEQKLAYSTQATSINNIAEYLRKLDAAQYDKRRLKTMFSSILEFYINSREQMGMMTKQAEKDALIQNVRQQLNNL